MNPSVVQKEAKTIPPGRRSPAVLPPKERDLQASNHGFPWSGFLALGVLAIGALAFLKSKAQRKPREAPDIEVAGAERAATLFGEGGYTIRFQPEHAVAGFAILLYNGQVGALPNNTYVVGPEHIALLEKTKIPYQRVQEQTGWLCSYPRR